VSQSISGRALVLKGLAAKYEAPNSLGIRIVVERKRIRQVVSLVMV
jgi:hypothetical protein